MWRWTVAPEAAPDTAAVIEPELFRGAFPSRLDGELLPPAAMLARLNAIGGAPRRGPRTDIVENRSVGALKSRGCYETPGGTILLKAHRAIESLTLDREVAQSEGRTDATLRQPHLQRLLVVPRERKALQALIDASQEPVSGTVRLKLYKGAVSVLGRRSVESLYDEDVVTFEERPRGLQPSGRGGLHPPQRPAPAAGRRSWGRDLTG